MKRYCLLTGISIIILLIAGSVWASDPIVTDITVTDVTPVSFSVVWGSDQPSSCNIAVFTDVNGNEDISATLTITPHPTRNGDSTIGVAAQNRGVMKIRISGLSPLTTYFFQTQTTSDPGNEDTFSPSTGPYLPVRTGAAVTKTYETGTAELPFTNNLIYQNVYEAGGTSPATGALLLASIEGGSYPLSAFVGDGLPSPQAAIDLNNLYSIVDERTLPLQGGEKIVLTTFYGDTTPADSALVIPRNHNMLSAESANGLAEMILILQAMSESTGGPDLSAIADVSGDNRIGLPESLHIMRVVARVQ